MSLMSKMIVVVVVALALVGQASAVTRSGNVIQRMYAGTTCAGTGTQTQLAQTDACFLTGNMGSNIVEYGTTSTPLTQGALSAGFPCSDVIGTIGKAPAQVYGYGDTQCSLDGNLSGASPTSGCFTGPNTTSSYQYVCGQCGLKATDFYNANSLPLRTMKLRWYQDSSCKVKTADADNLNVTTTCVANRDGTSSFSLFCGANGQCTMVVFTDTTNCCWTPQIVSGSTTTAEYGHYFVDGACEQVYNGYARITTGNLSGAFSTASLSLFSLAAAAIALFVAKEL